MFRLALAFVYLISVCSASALAQVSTQLSDSDLTQWNVVRAPFMTSLALSSNLRKIGFKGMNVGDELMLGNGGVAQVTLPGQSIANPSQLFMCGYVQTGLTFECKLSRLHPRAGQYETAFGEPVEATFYVIPDEVPPLQMFSVKTVSARVAAIRIEPLRQSGQQAFINGANQYFSGLFGYAPSLKSQYEQAARSIYSEKCKVDTDRINAKPIAALTSQDIGRRKECDMEALGRALTGAGIATQRLEYEWGSASNEDVVIGLSVTVNRPANGGLTSSAVSLTIVNSRLTQSGPSYGTLLREFSAILAKRRGSRAAKDF